MEPGFDGEVVETATYEVKVKVRQWGNKFDWYASNGDESYELFDDIDAALRDASDRY